MLVGTNTVTYYSQLEIQCRDTQGPSAALVQDLKDRGLLEDTLVAWGGEFGRTPFGQGDPANPKGRDHFGKGLFVVASRWRSKKWTCPRRNR